MPIFPIGIELILKASGLLFAAIAAFLFFRNRSLAEENNELREQVDSSYSMLDIQNAVLNAVDDVENEDIQGNIQRMDENKL